MLNLSAHAETRTALVKIFMDLLMLDVGQPATDLNTAEPPYRLYGCQSNVMYSRPQHLDGETLSSCLAFYHVSHLLLLLLYLYFFCLG